MTSARPSRDRRAPRGAAARSRAPAGAAVLAIAWVAIALLATAPPSAGADEPTERVIVSLATAADTADASVGARPPRAPRARRR